MPIILFENGMHILFAIVLIVAAGTLLVVGLLSLLRELLDRPSPLLEDDGLAWSSRYRGVKPRAAGSELNGT